MTLVAPAPGNAAGRASALPRLDDPHELARLTDFVHREFGLHLPESKRPIVASRLLRLLPSLGCADLAALRSAVEADAKGREARAMISALTTNVTHFFREEHHFRLLAETIVSPRLAELRAGRRLRIWSAGCSSGQEPSSIAMTVLDLLPEAPRLDIRILATDVDGEVVQRATTGIFRDEELDSIPARLRSRMTEPAEDGYFRMIPAIRAMQRHGELNLMTHWPMRGTFDAIFCRNVAIYFDKPTQARLWERLAARLRPGGLLLIGHSERLTGPARDMLETAGQTAYRLRPGAAPPAAVARPGAAEADAGIPGQSEWKT